MADEADKAQEQIEANLALALRATNRQPKVRANGFCHNCEAVLPPGLLFCDALCREDHERIEEAHTRAGNIGPG